LHEPLDAKAAEWDDNPERREMIRNIAAAIKAAERSPSRGRLAAINFRGRSPNNGRTGETRPS
jgi:hypothetical protein